MPLSDHQIAQLAIGSNMISPFINGSRGKPSAGLSSYGYDFRLSGNDIRIFKPTDGTIVDPLNFDPKLLETITATSYFILPPHSFALGVTVERFKIPRNILTLAVGKSTYARCGLILNVTPFEPEWEGYATIELSNTTPSPIKVYVENAGIGQLIFFECPNECSVSYADKKGKYNNQPSRVILPKAK